MDTILAQDENEVRHDARRSELQRLAGSIGQQVVTKGKTWVAVGRRRIGMERTTWMLRKAIQVEEAFLFPGLIKDCFLRINRRERKTQSASQLPDHGRQYSQLENFDQQSHQF